MGEMQEIILIDKPKGITSFDVIRVLRKKLSVRKMGHSGTLDPLATGLLIIGIGAGTKQLEKLIGLPKVYEAEILLGAQTDSGDITGKILRESPVPTLSEDQVKKALQSMVGVHTVRAPLYSALKKNGKPLYRYARSGEQVEAPLKRMEVRFARLLSLNNSTIQVEFDVSSGTYIRTLAEILAERLGTLGTIRNLKRISIGEYRLSDACRLEDL